MKKKLALMISELVVLHLLVLGFVWRLYLVPNLSEGSAEAGMEPLTIAGRGMIISIALYLLILAVICVQSYGMIIRPYGKRIEHMRMVVEENKKAEQIRREFVANVSHELKTPLTSISGFIETLQDGAAEDPEIRTKFIDIIAIETSRLKRLIEDLLVLSDIENKKDSEISEFDVGDEICNTAATLEPIAADKQILIELDLQPELCISGSADRFRQMMVNLIENAIKYSDADSTIWVRACETDEGIEVSVRDQGIGIAPEHHERLFERFYRVDKSRSKKAGGTGLGLSIVKHIAALFGAKLRVESQVGEGATFFVIFPKMIH